MAFTNIETKEINCKIVYFGPAGSGKSENLRAIYNDISKEVNTGILELQETPQSTKFFDFLPISLGQVKDYHLKLHIFTLPSNTMFESVQSVILKGIDGFVFVADSRIEAMVENIESLDNTKKMLTDLGHNVIEMPKLIQYNKRDLKNIVPLNLIRKELNASAIADQEAIAIKSTGIIETIQNISSQVLRKISN